jgi:hypothetical protein
VRQSSINLNLAKIVGNNGNRLFRRKLQWSFGALEEGKKQINKNSFARSSVYPADKKFFSSVCVFIRVSNFFFSLALSN